MRQVGNPEKNPKVPKRDSRHREAQSLPPDVMVHLSHNVYPLGPSLTDSPPNQQVDSVSRRYSITDVQSEDPGGYESAGNVADQCNEISPHDYDIGCLVTSPSGSQMILGNIFSPSQTLGLDPTKNSRTCLFPLEDKNEAVLFGYFLTKLSGWVCSASCEVPTSSF